MNSNQQNRGRIACLNHLMQSYNYNGYINNGYLSNGYPMCPSDLYGIIGSTGPRAFRA